jgi:hypothetical protein
MTQALSATMLIQFNRSYVAWIGIALANLVAFSLLFGF